MATYSLQVRAGCYLAQCSAVQHCIQVCTSPARSLAVEPATPLPWEREDPMTWQAWSGEHCCTTCWLILCLRISTLYNHQCLFSGWHSWVLDAPTT